MSPEISVVIPTYNRRATLDLCLRALEQQEIAPERFEIVVVDDGSTDGTADLLAEAASRSGGRLRRARQPNAGPSAARNAGVALTRGALVLLLDDDIIAEPALVGEHLEWHQRHADPWSAVLGYVRWSEGVPITPFMRFIDSNGMQFGYGRLRDGQRIGFRYFYTCNLSLKREILIGHPFDTRFPSAAFEDISLGYELERLGLSLHFHRRAAGWHHRTVDFDQFRDRMARAGRSLRLLHRAHPEVRSVMPAPHRRRLTRASRWFAALVGRFLPAGPAEANLEAYWRAALTDEMARGYASER